MAAARRTPKNTTETPATAQVEAPALINSQTHPDSEAPIPTVADTGVALLQHAVHPIVDAATGEPPVLDGLFERLSPHGTAVRCTRRLLEHEEGGITKLLLCVGAVIDGEQARVVLARLAEAGSVLRTAAPEDAEGCGDCPCDSEPEGVEPCEHGDGPELCDSACDAAACEAGCVFKVEK